MIKRDGKEHKTGKAAELFGIGENGDGVKTETSHMAATSNPSFLQSNPREEKGGERARKQTHSP